MAVSLSLNTSVIGRDEANRTSTISVVVYLTYSDGSHNGFTDSERGATLSISVGSYSTSFVQPFNPGSVNSGTETLYSNMFTVDHGDVTSDVSVPVYVSYYTNTGSGTVTASDTIVLQGIDSSGGSSGGDGGEDNGGDSGDSGDDSGGSSGDGTITPDAPSSNIQRHPDTNCIYFGSSLTGETYSNTNIILVTDAYIKFRTPSDLISCKDIRLIIPNNGFGFVFDPGTDYSRGLDIAVVRDHRYGWSGNTVITSNAFKHSGYTHYEQWECCLIKDLGATVYEDLKPDTEYVITLDTYDARFTIDTPVAIIIDYVARGGIHVKTNGMEKKYLITAKTGDTVSTYEPYVKNGDSWEPLGNVPITGEQYT